MALRPDALDWNLVRTFVAVVRAGSLAAAARELGLAHPTVARHIQQLEEALGLVLFDRTRTGLQINDAGARLAAAARAMQRGAIAFESASDQVRRAPISHVRITAAELISEALPGLLSTTLGSIGAVDEEFQVELQVTNDRLNLLQRDADMAIRHVRPEQQELIARRVGEIEMNLFASPDYLAQYGPVARDNLDRHRFVDGLSENHLRAALAQQGAAFGVEQIVFKSDSILSWRSAMLAGFGIAGLPAHMVQGDEAMPIDLDGERFAVDVWLVARPEIRNNRGLKAVYEALGGQLYEFLNPAPAVTARPRIERAMSQ